MSEFIDVLNYENVYLNWLRNIVIILTIAVTAAEFLDLRDYGVWMIAVAMFLLSVIQIDYLIQRPRIKDLEEGVPLRLDMLWVGSSGLLILSSYFLWKF
jgi:hypothetical protein